jgi:molybdopterin/thiamine biosynthesis adenylyltransferase
VLGLLNELAVGGDAAQVVSNCAANEEAETILARYLQELWDRGFLETEHSTNNIEPQDINRFDRFLHFLSEFELPTRSRFDLLSKIRQTRVVVIGTGGQGSWIIYQLLCLGVGRLRLVDPDVVELSNLNRSILYDESSIGRLKVEVAKESITRYAPRTEVETRPIWIKSSADVLPMLSDADLVIGAADTPPRRIREWIAEACHISGVPSVQASGFRVGPFTFPGNSACVGCDWQHQLERNPSLEIMLEFQERLPKGTSGLAAPVAAITAGVIGLEVARFLTGATLQTRNAVWTMTEYQAETISISRHPHCRICGTHNQKLYEEGSDEIRV